MIIKKAYYILFIITLICMTAVPMYTNYLYQPSENMIKLSSFLVNDQPDNLHFRVLEEDAPELFTIKTNISKQEISELNTNSYKLVISDFFCHWYKVYFNGHLIGSLGDINQGHSNIWNAFSTYDIDPELIKKENQLLIKAYAKHELGTYSPLLITDSDTANKLYSWNHNVVHYLNKFAAGFMLALTLLILIIYFQKNDNKLYLLFCFSSLFLATLHMIHPLVIPKLPVSLITFKKLVLLPLYISAASTSLIVYYKFRKKISLVFACLLLLIFFFLIFTHGSLFYLYFNYTFLIFILNFIVVLIICLLHFKTSVYARILFSGTICLPLTLFYDAWLRKIYADIHLSLFGIFLHAASIFLLVVMEIVNAWKQLASQKKMTEKLYKKSIKDRMTGLYNHEFITSLLEEIDKQFAIAIIDIDNFKQFNDNYGHQTGDEVITYLADKLKENTRKTDPVGRYGGDEFVIILYDCSKTDAERRLIKIKRAIEKPYTTSAGNSVEITISVGAYIAHKNESGLKSFKKADKALYKIKTRGKNDIHFYNGK